jgi:hypothetical protein
LSTLVVGLFDSEQSADAATCWLIAEGVPRERIWRSIGLTLDAIAAEAPGQSYANQTKSDSTPEARAEAALNQAIRASAAAVTVRTGLGMDFQRLHELLRRNGARGILRRRG